MTDLHIFEVEAEDIEALCNVARCVMRYTEVVRQHTGRGRPPQYATRVDAIADSARQLAEMVMDTFFCACDY